METYNSDVVQADLDTKIASYSEEGASFYRFYNWIVERHNIYKRRLHGEEPPFTDDEILKTYKFTNPFRENDRVTVWMRENWTGPNSEEPDGDIIFNCALFRMIGTPEFAFEHGWERGWDPEWTKRIIKDRLDTGLKTFTGAYIITNQGMKLPKADVVVDHFLTPLWEARETLAKWFRESLSLQKSHEMLMNFKGWGGGGFMSYELVTDLFYTKVLSDATDRYKWANAGPGAKRGLNRLHDRPLKRGMRSQEANKEMNILMKVVTGMNNNVESNIYPEDIDMRCIEHSLCEWDKYERVRLGQGRPRSLFRPSNLDAVRGSVL